MAQQAYLAHVDAIPQLGDSEKFECVQHVRSADPDAESSAQRLGEANLQDRCDSIEDVPKSTDLRFRPTAAIYAERAIAEAASVGSNPSIDCVQNIGAVGPIGYDGKNTQWTRQRRSI